MQQSVELVWWPVVTQCHRSRVDPPDTQATCRQRSAARRGTTVDIRCRGKNVPGGCEPAEGYFHQYEEQNRKIPSNDQMSDEKTPAVSQ